MLLNPRYRAPFPEGLLIMARVKRVYCGITSEALCAMISVAKSARF
jgi:hypothetical protein